MRSVVCGNVVEAVLMRFKDYMEIAHGAPPAPAGPTPPGTTPAAQPPAGTNQPAAPGTIQQGQEQLPPGTENEEWYKEILKTKMPPHIQQELIQARLYHGNTQPTGMGILKQAGRQVLNKMTAPSALQAPQPEGM
jgi:hypothetical protein